MGKEREMTGTSDAWPPKVYPDLSYLDEEVKRSRREDELFNRAEERLADSEKLRAALTDDLAEAHREIVKLRVQGDIDKQQLEHIRNERDVIENHLAQLNGHNLMLQGMVKQLKARRVS